MRIRIRMYIISILIILVFTIFCGCSNTLWKSSDELVFGTTLATKSLDPAKEYNGWFTVRYGIAETLFKLDKFMNIIPNLAEDYENIDGDTWLIKIRGDIKFHNGEMMTPEKVKKSLERSLALNKRAEDTLKIENIEVKDWELVITTKEVNPTFINDLCDPFASIINVDATEDFDNNPIGTGPFKIGSFNLKNTSYLDKYNDYWKGEPKLNNIKIIHVSDADTLTMAMQTGEIDVAQGVPYSSVSLFEDESLYKISSIDTSRMILMYYNYENKFLNDKNLRKAISMSINKPEYTSVLLKDSASYAKGPFPEGMKCGGKSINVDDYNADEARRILKDAGYEDNDNDGILEKDSEKLELKLITYSSRAELPILAQAIQSDLKDIGINVSVEVSDNIMDILNNSKFDICLYSNVTAPTGDSYAYLNNLVRSSGASNYGQYKNEESEKFLDLMESELDKEMRDNLAIKIIQNTIDDNGFDFIAHLKMKFIMKSNVVNFDIHQTDYYQINWETNVE